MKLQRMQNTPTLAVLALAAMFTLLATGGRTAWADSKTDIDRELLEKLGGEPVDDLDRELFAPEKNSSDAEPGKDPTRKAGGTERPGDEIVRELLLELRRTETNGKKAAASEKPGESATATGNPLVSIARQMRDVERRIGKNDCGKDTQQTQQQIVDQLDRLIEQAKKSCCGGGKPGRRQCKGGTSDRKKLTQAKKPSKSKKTGKGS
ncbi:MAG: hypothetical protein U9N87_10530, partial [Planctomycetota bacterium]|nr:hypothetical protein [Planctomycetota bacterium]